MKKKILCGLFILCTLLIGCDSDIEQRVLEDNTEETESTANGWNRDEEKRDLSEDFSESEDELMDFRLVDGNLYDKVKQNFEYESYDTITLYKFNDNWFAQVTNVGGILPEHFDDYDNDGEKDIIFIDTAFPECVVAYKKVNGSIEVVTVLSDNNFQTYDYSEEYRYITHKDDEFYIDFEGELISISEIIETDVLENCIAIVDDLAVAIAVLAVASVIICYPYIETVVTTVVTTVINWVRSFWRWLRGVFVTKTVTTTIVTTVTYYQVNVFSRDFELEKVENADEAPRDADFYYLAVVIGPDVYISLEKITESEAVAVLATDTDVSIDGTEFQLNTYTQAETDAQNIAMQAANYNGYSSITRHRYHGGSKAGVYFEHYHPAPSSVHGLPHSFFGSPEIRV